MSHFDVNILEDALVQPEIPLSFPLPYKDEETIINLKGNDKLVKNFSIIGLFLKMFSKYDYEGVYKDNEYKYSINKNLESFNKEFRRYMNERLSKTDEKLDEIVYSLIDQELRMNLITAKMFPERFKQVKEFMIDYYQKQNEINMPKYPDGLNFLRIAYYTVMKTIGKMFPRGIWVNKEQFEKLYQKYLSNPMSIIFLPNHQSHIDYIIIHLITIRFHMSIPTVIAGENLNVAIFGKFLKNLGAIFIKRSFNNELYTERNLENLIEFVLMNKIHLEVFIEGTRSRDGKLLLPKYGILKTLSRIYLNQRNNIKNEEFDLLFQPLAITYERIYEADGYFDELMGKDKKQESSLMILKNGLGNLIYGVDKDDEEQLKQFKIAQNYDNLTKTLHGRIFVMLGDNFKISEFIEELKFPIQTSFLSGNVDEEEDGNEEGGVNLKKLGFKILHEVNRVHYIPSIAIIGCSIQLYHYLTNLKRFQVGEVIPIFRMVINELSKEETSEINQVEFKELKNLKDEEIQEVIRQEMMKFFRYIKINKQGEIIIKNSIELLYYKNLTIHLIIHKCLVCFILKNCQETKCNVRMSQLYYIFTGFLKHDFLFDYNYNRRNELVNILNELKSYQIIDENFKIIDERYIEYMILLIKPFIESYLNCVKFLVISMEKYYPRIGDQVSETQLINDDLMSANYPTTKTLLKMITKQDENQRIESINKQYLLSCLFYLANLRLIKIFKNKRKTKAFVIIENSRDLKITESFLNTLLNGQGDSISEVKLNYMIDIIDKQFERHLDSKL
ncbi:hypothetical protein HYPBUDRAFT_4987 [Hyphopichia burtonii NRRL Y-1933]|uniref:Phospholipid/glycerol acyltransferase domain-containing protein n=1 Tax=Hyphopichia burtonii NRRL Y-1933 TaxID=984485 RepID=A0A1E4RNS9_9ASCO|nr:hypothetical protein HYPBUDRAFT_4987 [Hyphopichia burtonii NRRL Y-1933]ODV68917.1 hypothetical protein HYPBUDRAFT_4987 [Hyphopichia burtonii NRRL Y-1933]